MPRPVLTMSSRWGLAFGVYDGVARCWKVRTEHGYAEGASLLDAFLAAGWKPW